MPSPVAHTLAGLAAAQIARTNHWVGPHWGWLAVFVVAANAADLDFLTGALVGGIFLSHHGLTHSVVAALGAGVAVGIVARLAGATSPRHIGLMVGIAYLSHVALDFTAFDAGVPTDMALLWPFADVWIGTPVQVFASIDHGGTMGSLVDSLGRRDTLVALVREAAVMAGLWLLVRAALLQKPHSRPL